MHTRWEYQQVVTPQGGNEQTVMQECGKDGWELCNMIGVMAQPSALAVAPPVQSWLLTFKRPLLTDPLEVSRVFNGQDDHQQRIG